MLYINSYDLFAKGMSITPSHVAINVSGISPLSSRARSCIIKYNLMCCEILVANSLVAAEMRRSLATLVILDSLLSTLAVAVCEEKNYAHVSKSYIFRGEVVLTLAALGMLILAHRLDLVGELEAFIELITMRGQFAKISIVVVASAVLGAPNAGRNDIEGKIIRGRLSCDADGVSSSSDDGSKMHFGG